MVKDYMQDIVPPNKSTRRVPIRKQAPAAPVRQSEPEATVSDDEVIVEQPVAERSIRNLDVPQRRAARFSRPLEADLEAKLAHRPRRSWSWLGWLMLTFAIIAVAVIAVMLSLKTTVTITPRSHTIIFDSQTSYTAYPVSASSSMPLTYTVVTADFDDSELVAASGTSHVETKAQGTITVYNDYSKSPVKLIKNTRFADANGLIFRVPDDVLVPGKTGSTPGSVQVTVFADQAGETYNIGPSRFSLPGLRSSAGMYANVYAQSSAAMTGGFSGDKPSAPQSTIDTAVAAMKGRIEEKARNAALANNSTTTIALPDLIHIIYRDGQNTTEQGGVRLHLSAHVEIPVFPMLALSQTLAQGVSADAENAQLSFSPSTNLAAHETDANTDIGASPISFTLSGQGMIIWHVDTAAFAKALAGHDKAAFNTISTGFNGIETARARVEPLWAASFPADPSKIIMTIKAPAGSSGN